MAEAVTGLLIFGAIVSKLVSRRQEQLVEEIHRISFENRLGRQRTNLHLALSELLSVALECADEQRQPDRVMARIERVPVVLAGELRSLHDLLYRPEEPLDAAMLESILATMAEALQHLGDLVASGRDPSPMLVKDLANVRRLAAEICAAASRTNTRPS